MRTGAVPALPVCVGGPLRDARQISDARIKLRERPARNFARKRASRSRKGSGLWGSGAYIGIVGAV